MADLQHSAEDSLIRCTRALKGETNRGKILLLTAHIDELLEEILQAFLKTYRTKKSDRLFGYNGRLGEFATRIDIAYRLGLISQDLAEAYDTLKEIRNRCAHGLDKFSLADAQIRPLYESFKMLSHKALHIGPRTFDDWNKDKNEGGQFVTLCIYHISDLEYRLSETTQIQ